MPVRLSSPGLLWRGRQESLLKKGGLPPPPPPSSRKLFFRSRWTVPAAAVRGKKALPGGDASGARQGTSQDSGKATVQTNKASLFSALHFPHPSLRTICACPRHTFSATARKKLPEKGAFFMRCRFRTKRSQQEQGWRGGRDFRRRAATAVRTVPRSYRGRAPADNTRGGWDGRTGSNGAPPAPTATAWPPQTIAVATKEAAGSDSRDEGPSPGCTTQAVSFRWATMPRRASSATTFSAKTGSMASASGERPTCMVRQSKG